MRKAGGGRKRIHPRDRKVRVPRQVYFLPNENEEIERAIKGLAFSTWANVELLKAARKWSASKIAKANRAELATAALAG